MDKKRVLFQADGEQLIEGVVECAVTLPRHVTNDQDSPIIAVTYYQIIDDMNKVHTVSPACIQQVVTKVEPAVIEGAFNEFVRLAEKHIKVDSILSRMNDDKKSNYILQWINNGKGRFFIDIMTKTAYNAAKKAQEEKNKIDANTVGD